MSHETAKHPSGWEVWRWPEFQAFAKRLGIGPSLPTRDLVIYVPLHDTVTIRQEYLADTTRQAKMGWPGAVETTTVHNERLRTFTPVPDQQDVEGATDA